MMLTNYPFNRALVAERQRDRLNHAERMQQTRRNRRPRQTRRSTTRWSLASWLLGPSTQSRGAAGT
jgi:hypothetical protein